MENGKSMNGATPETIRQQLLSGKSAIRRRAAQHIGKHKHDQLGEALFIAFLREQQDARTWETQVAMIRALGEIKYAEALPAIEAICWQNKAFDEITRAAATTYVRLKRQNSHDATPVIELLRMGNYAVTMGALDALGYDRMIPSDDHIAKIIELTTSKQLTYPVGLGDPRYGLAAAAAGWNKSLVNAFLTDCTQANDARVRYVAEQALQNKYVKLR